MPWTTPDLKTVRKMTRDNVLAGLRAVAMIPNAVTRIVSDAMAALAWLVLLYIDWLAKQLLPDRAEDEWLERHGQIWLINADGSRGRKASSFASGQITVTGTPRVIVPAGTLLDNRNAAGAFRYQTVADVTIGASPTPVSVNAIDAGVGGNLSTGDFLTLAAAIPGVDGQAAVVLIDGGTDRETIDELRSRVLERIQQPPMGGDAEDYVAWALRVPGVTRAWSAPLEMGIGTVTLRFMCDELRTSGNGFPLQQDIDAVHAYLNSKRPVAVKDFFVVAPIPEPVDFTINNLDGDDAATRAAIGASCLAMMREKAKPAYAAAGVLQDAQTIYSAWVSDAVLSAAGVNSFDLVMPDHVMPSHGHMGVLGSIIYG